ncbi:MAG TPA: MDR family MFS transporter [Stellaceae bacterium]|nr:MDR family MFS transporter [Stellaceae bacterium]
MDQAPGQQHHPPVVVPHRGMVLMAALIATFMAAVESSIIATAMPTIVGDLGGFRLFSWVFAAYLLTMAVTVPIYGRLADLYGRKRIFFVGTGIFLIGTTLCGLARTMIALVVFRAVQGIGAGAIQPIASTVIGDIYTPAERARVQGYSSSVFGVSAVIGPALGAFLVEHVSWALVFWVNLPIGVVAIAMFAAYLPEKVERRQHRIDYLGAVLLIVGVGAPMLALVQARSLDHGSLAALVASGVAVLIFLSVHEAREPEPMVPFRLWRNRVIALSNIGIFGTGSTMMAISAFLPTYVQGVMGRSPSLAGLTLGCMSVSWMFASFAAGRLMIRTSYRLAAALGAVALVVGAVMLTRLQPSSGVAWAAAGSLVMGVGMGACNTAFLVSIQASVGWSERGVATGANMFMRIIGQSFGAALGGAILNFGVFRRVPDAGDAVNRLLQPALRHGLGPAEIARLTNAVAASLHDVYLIAAVTALATLVVSIGFPPRLSPLRPAAPAAR